MKIITIAGMILLLLCSFAIAENKPSLLYEGGIDSLIVNRNKFYIKLTDEVTGGCLPYPNKLKDKMEISLRKNGFQIEKNNNVLSNSINISIIGYKTSENSCAVHISVNLIFFVLMTVPNAEGKETIAPFTLNIGSHLLTGFKNNMQSRLEKYIIEYADQLYLEISRAKDKISEKFPYILKK